MFSDLRPAFALTLVFILLTGLLYPLAITGAAQVLFPLQANGSPVSRQGVVVGSSLVGQTWSGPGYFHGRPSAVNGDATTSSGSNLGPSSAALMAQIADRVRALGGSDIPVDLVTASGSGLDPDISLASALFQVQRVASVRGLDPDRVRALVTTHLEPPALGLLGDPHVNVLQLNLALEALTPQ